MLIERASEVGRGAAYAERGFPYLLNVPASRMSANSAEKMLLHLWGRATARERRTLKQLVYRLRQKIEVNASTPEILQTTPGASYKLVAD